MKYLTIGIGVVVVLGTIWLGAAAWRAHENLVTLRVRNAPLADVVRRIERQTKEKVRVDQKLDAQVTLEVSNGSVRAGGRARLSSARRRTPQIVARRAEDRRALPAMTDRLPESWADRIMQAEMPVFF